MKIPHLCCSFKKYIFCSLYHQILPVIKICFKLVGGTAKICLSGLCIRGLLNCCALKLTLDCKRLHSTCRPYLIFQIEGVLQLSELLCLSFCLTRECFKGEGEQVRWAVQNSMYLSFPHLITIQVAFYIKDLCMRYCRLLKLLY